MKEECFIAKSSIPNMAGLYDDILVCYCGTSACTKQRNYPLPSNFEKSVEIRADELTPEEEKAFYAHIFKTAKIL